MTNFLFYGCVILVSVFTSHFQTTSQGPVNTVCETPECHRVAQNFKNSIDLTKDPCNDFYQFACGNWPKNFPNVKPLTPNSTIQIRSDINNRELIGFLRQKNAENEPKAVHNIRKMFRSCADTDNFYEKGALAIKNVLRESGLPEAPPLVPNPSFDLPTTAAKVFKTIGVSMLPVIFPAPHPKNETQNILTLTYPVSGIFAYLPFFEIDTHESWKNSPQFYQTVLQKACPSIASENSCEALTQITDTQWNSHFNLLSDFEKSLREGVSSLNQNQETNGTSKTTPSPSSSSDPNILSLKELQNLTDDIASKMKIKRTPFNWTQYLFTLYEDIKEVPLDFSKPENVQIYILPGRSLIEWFLQRYFKNTPHYYEISLWAMILAKLGTYGDYNTAKYMNSTLIQNTTKSRDEVCLSIISSKFSPALSYYYVTTPYHKEVKDEISEMVVNIKQVLRRLMEEAPWMDEATKKKAVEKLNALSSYVSYPDPLLNNPERLDKYYESFEVTDNYVETFVKIWQVAFRQMLISLNEVNKKNDDSSLSASISPVNVNAFYSPSQNKIIIPSAIIGAPIYEHSLRALAYGSIGAIVGHEITHGFDNQGSRYNATGGLENWWNSTTLDEYKKRARCFQNVYENYTEDFQNLTIKGNSRWTLGEDIADNDGFKETLFAYRDYVTQNGPEKLLPSFENYTHEQLFTLSFANIWCENPTTTTQKKFAYSDHSPNGVRVNGVLKNSEEFVKIWNCPKGSNMNPNVDKCVMF